MTGGSHINRSQKTPSIGNGGVNANDLTSGSPLVQNSSFRYAMSNEPSKKLQELLLKQKNQKDRVVNQSAKKHSLYSMENII